MVMDFSSCVTPLQQLYTDERNNTIYIKRDDLLPFSFGGNKARIACEYYRDMVQSNCNHMVCYGNSRSNLCRVLSCFCGIKRIPCTILAPDDDDGTRKETANQRMCVATGAKIVSCNKTNVEQTVEQTLQTIQQAGENPYYIYGNKLGTGKKEVPVRAYVPVYYEILSQCASMDFRPDRIVLPVGTGTTIAGLLCGAADDSGEKPITVQGCSIARTSESAGEHVQAYVQAYADSAKREESFVSKALGHCLISDEYREVYGQCNSDVLRFIENFYRSFGIACDPTYTGKAFYGFCSMMKTNDITNEKIVLLHTGGTPLFFDMMAEHLAF